MKYTQENIHSKKIKTALKNILLPLMAAAAVSAAAFYSADLTEPVQPLAQGTAVPENIIAPAQAIQKNISQKTSDLLTLSEAGTKLSVPDIVKKAKPSVTGISSEFSGGIVSTGTGIVLSADGYIITNAHVVQNVENGITSRPEKILAVLCDNSEYPAEIIGADTRTDLAVIKISPSDTALIPAEFGNSELLEEGETAIAIGNPLGFDLYGSTTCGIISALNRRITVGGYEMTLIQTDAAINPGNSGGPLLNSSGQVVGINSSKIISDFAEGLGFAIPISAALPVIDDLISNGYVTGRPFLDIRSEDVNSLTAEYYGLPKGVSVRFIAPGSQAEKSGLETGDIIISLNGISIFTAEQLNTALEQYNAGDTILLTVYRPDEALHCEIPITLDEQKE